MRIALFGGSFDPFHLGHFLVARTAWEQFRLQQVVFLPCAHSPLKQTRPVARDEDRLAMLRAGLKGQPWATVSDWEIRQGGVSYTIDTVRAWMQKVSQRRIYWIMGSDQWDLVPRWKEPEELRRKLEFLVFPRPASPRPKKGFSMQEIPFRVDISATEIRRRVREKLSLQGLVLPAVESLVLKKRWYR